MTEPVSPPAPVTVPPYPALGSADFNSQAYAYGSAMPAVAANINATGEAAYTNAVAAKEKAIAAAASETATTTQADLAMGYRNTAQAAAGTATSAAGTATTKRDEAVAAAGTATTKADEAAAAAGTATTKAAEASASAAQAQVFATQQLKASSTTSLTPSAGSKTFAVEAGRSFVAGMYLVATSSGAPANKMSGTVVSYDVATGSLVLSVDAFAGAAARADWVIGVAVPSSGGGLARQVVSTSTACVAGVAYIVAAAGTVLTLPAGWSAGDRIAIIEAIGDGAQYTLDFGSTPLRGRAVGSQVISAAFGGSGELTYQNSTQGLV